MKSCSANSPSLLELRHQLRDLVAGRDGLQRDDVELAGLLRAEEVGHADPVALGLARGDQPLEHRLAVLGVEHDDLVALGVAGEVAEQRARAQVVLLGPHALQPRPEVGVDELLPGVALHAAAAPVELEQHVRVEVRVDLVEVDRDLADAPERGLGHGPVGRDRGAHGVVGEVEHLLRLALLAQPAGLLAHLRREALARLAVHELVHHGEALEGVLAVEDAGLVERVGLLAVGVVRAQAELAVDGRAADQQRVLEPVGVQLLHAQRHLLGGRDEQGAEADRRRVVLLGGVEDRADRDLLAEVDDRVAVVGEDRVDERLADVVHVAEHGREDDGALGVALELVEVLLELRDRALHHLGALEHEREDQLAGAELVADLLHGRQQHVVERRDRADLLDGARRSGPPRRPSCGAGCASAALPRAASARSGRPPRPRRRRPTSPRSAR